MDCRRWEKKNGCERARASSFRFLNLQKYHTLSVYFVSVRYACSSSCGFSIRFCFSFLRPRVHTTVSRVQAGRKRG